MRLTTFPGRLYPLTILCAFWLLTCIPFAEAGLVYSALRQGAWGIYFQPDLASIPQPVAEVVAGDKSAPALAHDRQHVAFEVQGLGVYVCPLSSSAECQVIRPPRGLAVRPTWHPTTGELLFVLYLADLGQEDSDIFVTRGSWTTISPLIAQTGIQDYPNLSPGGRLLAYTSSQTISLHRSAVQVIQQLWRMDLGVGVAQQLMLSTAQDIKPTWSPSGQQLAFASDRTGQFEIWVVNTAGSMPQQVTSGPGAKTWPTWSPDGKAIMFTLMQDGHQRLGLIDIDGSNARSFEPFGAGTDVELRDADWR